MYHLMRDIYQSEMIEDAIKLYSKINVLTLVLTLFKKVTNGNYIFTKEYWDTDIEVRKNVIQFRVLIEEMSNAELKDLKDSIAVYNGAFDEYSTSIENKVDEMMQSTDNIEERIELLDNLVKDELSKIEA